MEIVSVFKTSRGVYANSELALKNRAKDDDPRSPYYGQKETVVEVSAIHHHGRFFELHPMTVEKGEIKT